MQTIRGNVEGPLTVHADTTLRGNACGDIVVRRGCRLELRGNLLGDIILEGDARAEVRGNITGVIRHAG